MKPGPFFETETTQIQLLRWSRPGFAKHETNPNAHFPKMIETETDIDKNFYEGPETDFFWFWVSP